MRIRLSVFVLSAIIALLSVTGCERSDPLALTAEADDPTYRQAQQLEKQGHNQEALASYLKVIAKRGESAPESHLEAGLIYLEHIKDPIAAIYHFRKFLELQPNARQAVYVNGMVETAKREFARTLPARPLESQAERMNLLDQIGRLQRENDELKGELVALRNGVVGVGGSGVTAGQFLASGDREVAGAFGAARATGDLTVAARRVGCSPVEATSSVKQWIKNRFAPVVELVSSILLGCRL